MIETTSLPRTSPVSLGSFGSSSSYWLSELGSESLSSAVADPGFSKGGRRVSSADRGAVGVEGGGRGVMEVAGPPSRKNKFCPQDDKFGCILMQLMFNRETRLTKTIQKLSKNSWSDQGGVIKGAGHLAHVGCMLS